MTTKFQHTAARRRLPGGTLTVQGPGVFQHTAARRRLPIPAFFIKQALKVSTHSRPKAAARQPNPQQYERDQFQHTAARRRLRRRTSTFSKSKGFNTQPPEGGCQTAQSPAIRA